MPELNTKNMLIGVSGAVLATLIVIGAILVGAVNATNQKGETARACVESGGTWIDSDSNCLRGTE